MSPATVAGLLAGAAVVSLALAVRAVRSQPAFPLAPVGARQGTSPERFPGASRMGRRRRRDHVAEVERQVPHLLDLLAAGSSAGQSAELSLRRAVGSLPGALGHDLRQIFEHADLGARWRDEVAAYAEASGSRDLGRAVTVLERTEVLGSSLIDATRDLAAGVRQARRAATLERARTAPVKMLFPLVFLILPAFLLLTVVPVLLATIRSIS